MSRASFCLALVVGLATSAEAQPRRRPPPHADTDPVDEATARAREAYARGQTQFRGGQVGEALASFEAAYAAKPHPTVLVSIAECQERLGDYHAAVASFERYLTDSPSAHDAASIQQRIAQMRARPARVSLRSEPAGATIFVDSRDTGKETPAEIEMPAGTRTFALRLEGHAEATQELTVEFAETRELSIALTPIVADEPSPEPPPPVPEPRSDGGGAAWIAAGITGMGLVAGSVLGFLALSDKSEFDDRPTVEVADRGERFALFADIAFGVAVAAGVTTAVLLLTGPREQAESGMESMRLRPLALRGGAGLAADLGF